jgi:putative hydrolase of the HAD superfamily
MAEIKNIIFDLGMVILNVDYQNTLDAFKKLGVHNIDDLYAQSHQAPVFDQLERGEISGVDFCNYMEGFIPKKVGEEAIVVAWNAMLGNLPWERLDLLRRIKLYYRLFLLSNTNTIHFAAWQTIVKKECGFEGLSDIFEKEYYSHQLGMRKPEIEIFDHVLKENGLDKRATLFIDDSLQHIKGAANAGIKTVWLTSDKILLDLFDKDGHLKE